jgi:phage terminase Nu1 subunit (DNA packaging protein)
MAMPNGDMDDEKLLTEVQAADLLRMSSRTLQAWRSRGVGPPFVRAGRAIRYRRPALISWTLDNTVTPQQPATPRP